MTLTTDTFDDFALRDDWLGFGYIGGRRHLTAAERARADSIALAYAIEHGWSEGDLFLWGNSKLGRWFSDYATVHRSLKVLRDVSEAHGMFDLDSIRKGI